MALVPLPLRWVQGRKGRIPRRASCSEQNPRSFLVGSNYVSVSVSILAYCNHNRPEMFRKTYLPTWDLIQLVGIDFGRSIGKPIAREITACEQTPNARETLNSTV